jgi:micrococcal nuclease
MTPEVSKQQWTKFLPTDPSGTRANWWRRRSGRQRWGMYGAGAVAALLVIGSTNANDGEGAATGAASPTAAVTGAVTSAPPPTVRPTARPTASTRPTATPTRMPTPTPAPPLGSRPLGTVENGTVVDVVDGDTIKVDINGAIYTVRYIGIDTPETVHPTVPVEWMGPEASAANKDLVAGKEVVLERDVSETDQYGRLLRYVWIDGGDAWLLVNLELVRLGFANASTWPPDVAYQELFRDAEADARDAGVGLWGATPPPQPTAPPPPSAQAGNCDPSYPTVCIPPAPPDLDCGDISYRRFTVLPPDPHRFDGDHDGIGCES